MPRKKKRNSTIRMNPNNDDKVTITITAPASQLEQAENLGSDLAMTAMQQGVTNTRGNPRKKKASKKRKGPRSMKVFGNPIHFPKTRAQSGSNKYVGRPANENWWIADLYDSKSKKIITHIGKGSKRAAETEAQSFLGHRAKSHGGSSRSVKSVALSGPYSRKPNSRTKRK